MFLANREKEALKFLNEYGQATKQQLKDICNASDKNIENLVKNRLAKEIDDIILIRSVQEKDQKLLMSLELLKYFLLNFEDITWHSRSSFPFYITLYRNDKVFDITAVLPGEEVFMTTALNRSQGSRILIVAPELTKPLRLDKPIRYYIPEQQLFLSEINGEFVTDNQANNTIKANL